jgi:DivIVA domain-containing protein
MMDLTPLDVRKKKGDFRRGIRGYEQAQVDDFLELVADRMEVLVREASSVGDRIARLEQQVAEYRDREKALTEALVSAQQMREDIRTQSTREVELLRKQAEQEADRIRSDAIHMREREEQSLEGLRSRQFQFLASYRKYLEQELSELAAMAQGFEMHNGGSPRGPALHAGTGARATPPPFELPAAALPPASAPVTASGPAESFRDTTGPVAGQAAERAQTPVTGSYAAPSAPFAPASPEAPRQTERAVTPPAAESHELAADSTTSDVRAAAQLAEDASEAQLEEALARWEPELGPEPEPRAPVVEPDESEDEESGLESADGAGLEFESTDEDDLLLSADDEVAATAAQSGVEPVESEEEVDLAFLEFGEDDVAEAEDPAVAAAAAATMERDVSAAMVDSDSDLIDIGTALGDELDEIELPMDAITGVAEPTQDEAEAAIEAAFDFDAGDLDGVSETQMSGPRVSEPPSAEAAEADDDRAADIDFVDSLLMDAESVFEEEPSGESLDAVPAASSAEASADPFGDTEFDDIAAEDDRPDDYRQEIDEDANGADPDLIDLDSFRGFSKYEPPAPSTGDVSSLTLHPMFFEEEPSELDVEEHEESRRDHWSS